MNHPELWPVYVSRERLCSAQGLEHSNWYRNARESGYCFDVVRAEAVAELKNELMQQMDMGAELFEPEAERVGSIIEDVFQDWAARR